MAPAPRREPGGPTVEDKAFELGFDPEAIFRLVADEVAYEAYPGALRGAKGTLWGLAGNSVDQALLLAALLDQALVTTRFAVGELDEAQAEALADSMAIDEAEARSRSERLRRIDGETPAFGRNPTLTSEQVTAIESARSSRQEILDRARLRLAEGLETVERALADAGVKLPEAATGVPERERTQHVWVQYADGGTWIDLDPTFPNAEAGEAPVAAAETLDELPDELYHRVLFRAVVEEEVGGAPARRDALTYDARVVDLVGVPVLFSHVDPNALRGLGVAVTGLVDGAVQYTPHLIAGTAGESGEPITFGGGAGAFDALGGGETEGQAIGEWLEIDVLVPDAPPRRIVREVFDRIGVAARAAGEVELSALPPVELVEKPAGGQMFMPMELISVISVVGQATPSSFFQQDYAVEDLDADVGNIAYGYPALRDALQVEIAAEQGYRWYHNGPNLTAVTLTPVAAPDAGGTGTLATALDVLHQGYGVVPLAGASGAAHPRVVAGVLAHVAERLMADGSVAAGSLEAPPEASAGRVFEEAARAGVAIRTLDPDTGDASDLDVSEPAKARIAGALAAGYAVVVPESAVEVDGERLVGWWQVDPATGTTFDLMENGRGAAPLGEETVLITRVIIRNQIRAALNAEAFAIGVAVGLAIGFFTIIVTN